MILDAQNLYTFSLSVKLWVCNLRNLSFRRHFLVCAGAEHVKLVLCTAFACFDLATFLHCLRLTVASNCTCCCTQQAIFVRQDVGVTDNC